MVMLLCCSRYKFVWFSDRPFTSESASHAHEKSFEYFRGVPRFIIYDQDAVFLYDENIGDYRMTTVFESYVKSRPFEVIFCRPADPESKGKVENAVKYVKQNFLLNRQFSTIDNLNAEADAWLRRTGNAMLHGTTRKVPYEEWCNECKDLLPYIPMLARPADNEYTVIKDNTSDSQRQVRMRDCASHYPGRLRHQGSEQEPSGRPFRESRRVLQKRIRALHRQGSHSHVP